MKTSDQYSPNLSLGIVLQGASGMGKTTAALQFPRPYILDCDNNISGAVRRLREKGLKFKYDIGNIADDEKEIPEGERYDKAITRLNLAVKDDTIDTIIIDSGSSFSDYIIAWILKTQVQTAMRIQDWGIYLNAWTRLITKMRSARKIFILIVHETMERDDLSQRIEYNVALPGQIANRLGAMMSDIWHFEIASVQTKEGKKDQYCVRCAPTPQLKLKCSLGLPALFASEDFSHVQKALDAAKAPVMLEVKL